jgi:hypothetical protein
MIPEAFYTRISLALEFAMEAYLADAYSLSVCCEAGSWFLRVLFVAL